MMSSFLDLMVKLNTHRFPTWQSSSQCSRFDLSPRSTPEGTILCLEHYPVHTEAVNFMPPRAVVEASRKCPTCVCIDKCLPTWGSSDDKADFGTGYVLGTVTKISLKQDFFGLCSIAFPHYLRLHNPIDLARLPAG
eukprot:INCI10410.1.p1 GENE.INCI10410.1~~INCI10410.1.p1  ORF type:complete len:136 (-),score=18.73 INCI10410.1:164-571(-)